jgi:hypothetical protein
MKIIYCDRTPIEVINLIKKTHIYKQIVRQNLIETFYNNLNYCYDEIDEGKLCDIFRYSPIDEIAELMGMCRNEKKQKFI